MNWKEIKNLPFVRAAINTGYHLPVAKLATLIFRQPASRLTVIGITGTDGKTTTAYLIYHLLHALGHKTALISTVGAKLGNYDLNTGLHVTTPNPFQLQKLLKFIADQGYEYVVLEATSHGLDQNRLYGIKFAIGVITNITHEHLDYHLTENRYLAAKSILTTMSDVSLINLDDANSASLYQALKHLADSNTYSFSIDTNLDKQPSFHAGKISLNRDHSTFIFTAPNHPPTPVKLALTGKYNIENATAALGTICLLNQDLAQAAVSLKRFSGVPGRLEPVDLGQPFSIYIDFAHTPNAMRRVLTNLKQFLAPAGRLIVIFGCAGLRDTQKRELMGRLAGQLADYSLVTAEDPRTEDLTEINHSIVTGLTSVQAIRLPHQDYSPSQITQVKHFFDIIPNRQEAIEAAVNLAQPNDIVVSLGKGHEKSMCFGTTELPWSERKAFKKAIYQRYHIHEK